MERVVSCYEAGRDGFWLHRALLSMGIENVVVDSSSIEVNRRSRRVKTDRVDAEKLLSQLIRFKNGEEKVWSVVRVPTPEQEDGRQLSRELGAHGRAHAPPQPASESVAAQGISVNVARPSSRNSVDDVVVTPMPPA